MIRNFLNKQKKISFVFAAALAIFAITGCKGTLSEAKTENNSDVSKISFLLTSGGAARTAIPDYDWNDYVYDLQMISQYDPDSAEPQEPSIAVAKKAFSNFESGTMALPKGICYKFILTGYLPDENRADEKVITGETVVTLTDDNQTIPFKMYPVTGGFGKVVMYIYFPADGVITSAKIDISDSKNAKPTTVRQIYDYSEQDDTKIVKLETDYDVPSGKIQYVNINLFDVNGALVFDYAESAYVLNGATSFSQFELTSADYYRKKASVTIKKDGVDWNGAPEKIILKDKTDPTKKYELTGTNGVYEGQLPENDVDYEVYIEGTNGNKDIYTGIIVNPTKAGGTATGEVISVKLPAEDDLSFNPSGSLDSGIISSATDGSGNTEIIVPKDQDFKVEVSVKDGYEIPSPAQITVGDKVYPLDENNKAEITYNSSDVTNGNLSSGVTGFEPELIRYSYEYAGFEWSEGSVTETEDYRFDKTGYSYTVNDEVELIKDYSHIEHDNGYQIIGWKIVKIDNVDYAGSTITSIPKGTTGKLVLNPVIIPGNQARYLTEIWVENIEDDGYTMVWSFEEFAEAGSTVTSDVHGEWLSDYTVTQDTKEIKADGSTKLETRFKRKLYTITLDPNGGKWSDSSITNKEESVKFEAPLPATLKEIPTKENYEFIGWKIDNVDYANNDVVKLPETALKSETYTAQYKQVGAQYKIVTKKETLTTGVYDETTETKNGKIGNVVTANVTTIAGFNDPIVTDATVTEDGEAVVEVVYNRKNITLTFDPTSTAKWSDSSTGNKTVTGKFEANITKPEDPVREYYEFTGWSPSVPEKFPAANTTYTATWKQVSANYNIQVLVENTSGTDDVDADKSRTEVYEIGKTPTEAEVLTGLEEKSGFTRTVSLNEVTADGNAVQTVRYVRNTIKYTFILNGGMINNSTENVVISGKYGTALEKLAKPTRANFKFVDWTGYTDSDKVFGLVDKEFTAVWQSEITGQGTNPMLQDMELVVSGTSTITATIQLPYVSEWEIVWMVDGKVLSEKGTSITIANAKDKVYTIYVEATDKVSNGSIILSQMIEYSTKNAQ